MHILLIEDDLDLGRALQAALKAEGITSQWLRRAADAPTSPDDAAAACVLLDLSLPDGTGLDLLRRWRRQGVRLPILIITAHSALEDRLQGLDSGADDYIVKPFATAELVSRMRAVLRRCAQQVHEVWSVAGLQIEPRRHRVLVDGKDAGLSPREFSILLELASDAGSVVPKGSLAHRIAPLGDPVDFATLDVHLSNLRRKIGGERIRTVRGVGYMLQA